MLYTEEITKTADALIKKLVENGIYGSEALMPQHLVTAGINGFCPEDMYTISVFDWEAYQAGNPIMVLVETDLLLFLYTYSRIGQNTDDVMLLQKAMSAERIQCTFKIYSEYVELMQKISRHFRRNPEIYLEQIAGLTAYLQCNLSTGYIHLGSMLHIKRFTNREITIRLPKDEEISMPFSGSRVFIPGCGLSILSHLNMLQQLKDIEFTLNDIDLFVATVVRKVAILKRLDNVLVNQGNFADCQLADNIGLVILSLLHKANKGDFIRLAKNLRNRMTPGGQVIGFFPDLKKTVNSDQCISVFQDQGFKLVKSQSIAYQKIGIDGLSAKILSALPDTLVNKYHNQKISESKGSYFVLER